MSKCGSVTEKYTENVTFPPTLVQPHLLQELAICHLTGAEDAVEGTVAAETAGIIAAEIAGIVAAEIAETEEEGIEDPANSATYI